MNSKLERDGRYPNERYRDNRDDRISADRFGDQRWLRSPDQEFETSGPYRQPQGEGWNQAGRTGEPRRRLPATVKKTVGKKTVGKKASRQQSRSSARAGGNQCP